MWLNVCVALLTVESTYHCAFIFNTVAHIPTLDLSHFSYCGAKSAETLHRYMSLFRDVINCYFQSLPLFPVVFVAIGICCCFLILLLLPFCRNTVSLFF